MDDSAVTLVGNIQIGVLGGDRHGDRRNSAGVDGRLTGTQGAGLGIHREGLNGAIRTGTNAGVRGQKYIIDGDQLAGGQKSGPPDYRI